MLIASLCAFHAEDSLFKESRRAKFTFFRFLKRISHVLFYLFDVNCAFLFVSDYAIATNVMLLV